MAIQHRRGQYLNFDPSKMVEGEAAIVKSGDPNTTDGKAAYIAFAPGNVKRLVTANEVQDVLDNAIDAVSGRATAVADELQEKIDNGEIAVLTITDNSIPWRKLDTVVQENIGVQVFDNWTSGYYDLRDGTTSISLDAVTEGSNYLCQYQSCNPGDMFFYTGKGTSVARRYAFLSSASGTNNIISTASSTTAEASDFIIIAPENAQYVLFNSDKRVNHSVKKKSISFLNTYDDLNDFTEEGNYYCNTAAIASTLDNLPEEMSPIGFYLDVKYLKQLNSGNISLQTLVLNSTTKPDVYIRTYLPSATPQWGNWTRIYQQGVDTLLEIKNLSLIEDGSDLDDIVDYGSYYCSNATSAKTIKNLPFFVDSSFSLYVVNSHKYSTDEKYIRQIIFGNKTSLSSIYTRALNIEWGEWQLLINAGIYEQPKIVEANNFVYNRPQGTVKKTINVATNNVAHYWCQGRDFSDDVQRYLADVPIRIARWKRWLIHSDIDVLFLQECEDYVDHGYSGHTKTMKAFDYLYAPFFNSDDEIEVVTTGSVLPENRIDTQTDSTNPARRKILDRLGLQIVIHENENHEPEEQKGCVIVDALSTSHYTGKGYYNWRIVQFESVGKILLINVHNFAGLDSIATYYERRLDRKKLLDELESLINSKRTEVGFDYFIIAGDFNSKLAKSNLSQANINTMNSNYPNWKDDREYILEFCNHISGIPVNGGVLGWFTTISQEESSNAYDNIIVSNNIRIEDIQCDPVLVPAGYLHTDHTPVVTKISFM